MTAPPAARLEQLADVVPGLVRALDASAVHGVMLRPDPGTLWPHIEIHLTSDEPGVDAIADEFDLGPADQFHPNYRRHGNFCGWSVEVFSSRSRIACACGAACNHVRSPR